MKWISRCRLLSALASLGIALWVSIGSSAFAQSSGASSGGGSLGTFGSSGTTGGGSGSSGGGGSSSGGSSAGGGGGGTQSSPFSNVGGGGGSGGSNQSTVSNTNFLSPTFSNPLYEGRPNQTISSSTNSGSSGTTQSASQPGGFGQSSFGSVTTTTTSSRTSTSSAQRITGSSANTARMRYATIVKFPIRPPVPGKLQADLRDMIDRSTAIKDPADIKISVQGHTVTLAGRAVDDDERRLIEGMIRLTPGVRTVQNELQVPEPIAVSLVRQ